MKTRLDTLTAAHGHAAELISHYAKITDQAVASYVAMMGPVIKAADSYNATMAPLAHALVQWQARMQTLFPQIKEDKR